MCWGTSGIRPYCTLGLILASGWTGVHACSDWHPLTFAGTVQSAEAQPPSVSIPFPPGQMPTTETWPQFIDSARQIALTYTKSLPDFICTQKIKRLAKFGQTGNWSLVDQIATELSYRQRKEHYRILAINNRPPSPEDNNRIRGFSSEGDFGNGLYLLFAPESKTSFLMEGPDRVQKRQTVRARFTVSQPDSRFRIGLGDQTVTTAYGGRCWIDLATRQVVRLESEARDIPRSIPVRSTSHLTEYDLVEIAGKKYWLPVHSLVLMELVNGPHREIDLYKAIYGRIDPAGQHSSWKVDAKNDIEYRQYRKFGTEIRLVTDE